MKLKISSPHGVPVIIETRTVNDLSAANSFRRVIDIARLQLARSKHSKVLRERRSRAKSNSNSVYALASYIAPSSILFEHTSSDSDLK